MISQPQPPLLPLVRRIIKFIFLLSTIMSTNRIMIWNMECIRIHHVHGYIGITSSYMKQQQQQRRRLTSIGRILVDRYSTNPSSRELSRTPTSLSSSMQRSNCHYTSRSISTKNVWGKQQHYGYSNRYLQRNEYPTATLLYETSITTSSSEITTDTLMLNDTTTTITEEAFGATINIPSTTLLSTPSSNNSTATKIITHEEEFIRPERDIRSYRYIQLSNQLQCLLVCSHMSNDTIGIEAASVHVQAGHFDDTIPGLAHFHEHMLFLGTNKYPNEEEYETYLNQYGGYSNAYTDMEDTNYYFTLTTNPSDCYSGTEVKCTDALYGAMDRLAQFFIAPKFDPDMVHRELCAIDSEYKNGLTNDSWRIYQLLKLAANPNHPISKFGCGNYQTLLSKGNDQLLSELHQFWETYYQTWNLRLAVVGHGSLDALQRMVEETFGQIPSSTGKPRRIQNNMDQYFVRENAIYNGITAYGKDQVGIIRHIIPISETRTIKIMFVTPPLDDPVIRTSKPYRSLSHFLGHESPGSLHALLNEDDLLTSLSSGLTLDTSDFSLFSLTLGLTPKGMKKYQHVIDLVFQWIAVLNRQSYEQRAAYHNELRQISDMSFRFRENDDPTEFCSSAAEQLFEDGLDPARVLIVSNEVSDYDPVVEDQFLARLRPDNCMIHILNSDITIDPIDESKWKIEPWYGAKFLEERFSQDQIMTWSNPLSHDERLYAPALNIYIPTDFSLRCDDSNDNMVEELDKNTDDIDDDMIQPPKILLDRSNLRLWHKMDRYWRVPKAIMKAMIISPSTYMSPRSMTLNRIYQRVLNDDLNSYVYDASQAGCNYRVSCTPSGYRISVRGYSEKLPFLLDTLTSRMISLIQQMKSGDTKLRTKFNTALDGLLRETKNYRLDTPHEVANYNSRLLIEENVWYLDSYLSVMEGDIAKQRPLTIEECAMAAEESLTGRIRCEAICMGNINYQEAQNVASVFDRHFLNQSQTLSDYETPCFRSMKLPTKDEAVHIFGPTIRQRPVPIIYQELAYTETEENNAIEYILQAGCELELGYEGLAILDLITHIAYNSAFNMLRTREQLGYVVSAHARKTAGGTWGMSIVVQSSVALPEKLEERCEAWLKSYRQELQDMSPEAIAQEASAVVAQLLETDTKLSQEVGRVWGEILNTEGLSDELRIPEFDRIEYLADELIVAEDNETNLIRSGMARKTSVQLKQSVLDFFDHHFALTSSHRRLMSSRVYSHASKKEFQMSLQQPGVFSSYADMRHLKQFLSTWPSVPYWIANNRKITTDDAEK